MNVSKVERAKRKSSQWSFLKVALFCGMVGFLASGILQFICKFGDWKASGAHAFVGLLFGFMAAPSLSTRKFRFHYFGSRSGVELEGLSWH